MGGAHLIDRINVFTAYLYIRNTEPNKKCSGQNPTMSQTDISKISKNAFAQVYGTR